jgi:hypothetical protein
MRPDGVVSPREFAGGERPRNPAESLHRGRIPRCARNDRAAWLAALLLGAVLVTGCRQEAPPEPNSLTDTAERGPFKFTVEVTPKQVWIGDPITIRLRVETPEGQVVQFPSAGDFGELEVLQIEASDPRPGAEGGLVWQQTITATSYGSGVVEIPALVVKYAEKPADASTQPSVEHELAIGSLKIEVRSALTSQDSVLQPRDITGTLTPPDRPLSAWAWAAIVSSVMAAAALVVWLIVWLRRLARRPAPPILPEVWALRELSLLEAASLAESWQPREFYYGLSEIVRVYIERKFSLAAPEMTTEEFLGALARDRGVLPYDAYKLREFLEACDLVKYAALQARPDDGQQALGIARAFVDATAAAAERRPEPGGQAA